jgi:hypothetical protein
MDSRLRGNDSAGALRFFCKPLHYSGCVVHCAGTTIATGWRFTKRSNFLQWATSGCATPSTLPAAEAPGYCLLRQALPRGKRDKGRGFVCLDFHRLREDTISHVLAKNFTNAAGEIP